MVDINIQNGQGITQAIKSKLINDGVINKNTQISGSIWSNIMNEIKQENASNKTSCQKELYSGGEDINGLSSENFVVKTGVIKLTENLWNKILSFFKPSSVQKTETPQNIQNTEQIANTLKPENVQSKLTGNIRQDIDNAQKLLVTNLSTMSEQDLSDIGISSAKRDRMINYLNNITYDNDPYGTAKAVKNGIVISENGHFSSQEDMIKVLIHEANHCDEEYLFKNPDKSDQNDLRHRDLSGNPVNNVRTNSVEEEKMCERIGLLTTAKLIDKGILSGKDYAPYTPPEQFRLAGEDLSKYKVINYLNDKNQLENDLNGWIERNYPGLPDNLSGDVTIRHMAQKDGIQLKSGDEIRFNNQTYTIGKDGVYLSAQGRTTTCQLTAFDMEGNTRGIANNIVLSNMEPTQEELKSLYSPNQNFVKEENGQYSLNLQNIPITVYRDGKPIINGKM